MRTVFGRFVILAVLFCERFVLSFVFFCLAWAEINKIGAILSAHVGNKTAVYVSAGHHIILFVVGALVCLLLLFGRSAVAPPQTFKLVFVPLAATFFPLFYFVTRWFPAPFQMNLCPKVLQMPLLAASLACILIGPIIALWGILYLGRSFGIFVTVRKVVLKGPYRWMRHPMYLGWGFSYIGIALANFSSAYLLVVGIHMLVILYRAHLEETELSARSPEYREYMRHSGFIFPRFRQSLA